MKNSFLLLLLSCLAFGQTHRFIYEMKFKPDSTKSDYITKNMVLDVNPDEVKFYPYSLIKMDSMSKTGHPRMGWETELPFVKRKKNSDKNSIYVLNDALFKIDSDDKISWKLSPEIKKMDGYVLQKATADFGGRKWIAWFSKDVDISEGPYKFRGLPGMIFSVEDDKGNYFFKLLKSTKLAATYGTSQYFENFAGKTALPYTQKQYQQKLLQVYNDPYFEWKQQMMANPNQVFWIMETKVTHIEQFRDLSKDEQNRMRRENNPIEIDKAVHYPLK